MRPRMVITKLGYDAEKETDPNNKIFDSDYETLKYYLDGNITVSPPSGTYPYVHEAVLVTHNLGYRPFFVAYFQDTTFTPNRYYLNPFSFADAGFSEQDIVYATTTQLILRLDIDYVFSPGGAVSPPSYNIYYKIFKNNVELS